MSNDWHRTDVWVNAGETWQDAIARTIQPGGKYTIRNITQADTDGYRDRLEVEWRKL